MYTTIAKQVDITPSLWNMRISDLFGSVVTSGRLVFLPTEHTETTITEFETTNDDLVWSSKKGVKAKDILSYIDSLDG